MWPSSHTGPGASRAFVDVRTTEGTPSLLDLMRKEAVGGKK
ncbi:hypothetical protein [Streptomyces albicerus]|nr:hypothetical protein [Streptomyces albicerus]